ncbi:LacI family DNA-binding transcriptional regulator [Rhodococcus erythropolis]|uniref:LacI family DNA-binding transcriptional regulator n=1 Tax=Rhodococcus erythropolis TaxID=1833 RepID=UPI002948E562|nr:LacI family DNA-binding transcriptional regulator [Rhodococcus erythropolis]MDV6212652.1 LacI family DNA-binding transcriptional regulator [Rhodococcus erythropolis]
MNNPSIDDVADAAGVHRSTVSRAFSRPEAVRTETREHVLRIAADLGYSMSPVARALRSKSSRLVPLIVPDITNPFFSELARTTAAAAETRGYHVILCITNGDADQTAGYLSAMQAMYSPFGVVAPSTKIDLDALARYGVENRVVVLDRVEDDPTIPTVTVDSGEGIALALEHLMSLGHRAIAYAPGIVGTHTAQDRWDAFRRTALVHGLSPTVLQPAPGNEVSAGIVDQWLQHDPRPTAIIASNDLIAFALISELGSRGVAVPRDVSIIGFDGLDFGARFNPRLTSVRQPIAEMGRIAIELGDKLLFGEQSAHIVLRPTLLLRSSTQEPSR